jgi:histidyl-tRNA synthetase
MVLRAIDKLDRLGSDGVRMLLGSGRKDESGDFTKGAGLAASEIDYVIENLQGGRGFSFNTKSGGVEIHPKQERQLSKIFVEGLTELDFIEKLCRSADYDATRIRIDPSVVRGLEYYTGPVFEVELTFPIEGDDGKPVRFGSVAGGGRYDGLVGRFRGENIPATGISIGVSRLMAALQHLKKIDTQPEPGPVVVTVFDADRIADYQKMVAALRNGGIRAELYLGSGKFGAQMKYADKRGSPCAVIQGGDEKAKGEVQIKDLILGATISQIKDRDEYKAKQAEAQFAVPEHQLVDGVRKVLARHSMAWS